MTRWSIVNDISKISIQQNYFWNMDVPHFILYSYKYLISINIVNIIYTVNNCKIK